MSIARAADFAMTGEHHVRVADQTVVIYRDPENGWWYEQRGSKVHFSQCVIGFNKKEALATIHQNYAAK